jgi:hypothetical protein
MLQILFYLNPTRAPIKVMIVQDDVLFIGKIVWNDDVIKSTLKSELYLFHWLFVWPLKIEKPLVWCSRVEHI